MAVYQFIVRSFHPEKDFGWSGLKFSGDNRGFSSKPNGLQSLSTSRVWHQFQFDTLTGLISHIETESNDSHAPWTKEPFKYTKKSLKPQGVASVIKITDPDINVMNYKIDGKYSGENHAMPGSIALQETIGVTYVPTLNVRYQIWVTFNRLKNQLDVVAYVTGDGFPNCEALIIDSSKKAVFLGVHVRKGAAPTTLTLNADYPMIASAMRFKLTGDGVFSGEIGDELARRKQNRPNLTFQHIEQWNDRFSRINPNFNHCMGLERLERLKECFQN